MKILKNQISWKYSSINYMKILKYQISWQYSRIKFRENTQVSITWNYSSIKFHKNTQESNFVKIINYMNILKYQISWKYSRIKFRENTQVSITWKYSSIKFHENTQESNFVKILKYQLHENIQVSNFMKIRPVRAECYAGRRRDGRSLKYIGSLPLLRSFITGVSLRRPGFDLRPIHVGLLVDKRKWDRPLSQYFGFPYQFHSTNAPYSLIHVTEAI
jgi:hypothetical protein